MKSSDLAVAVRSLLLFLQMALIGLADLGIAVQLLHVGDALVDLSEFNSNHSGKPIRFQGRTMQILCRFYANFGEYVSPSVRLINCRRRCRISIRVIYLFCAFLIQMTCKWAALTVWRQKNLEIFVRETFSFRFLMKLALIMQIQFGIEKFHWIRRTAWGLRSEKKKSHANQYANQRAQRGTTRGDCWIEGAQCRFVRQAAGRNHFNDNE